MEDLNSIIQNIYQNTDNKKTIAYVSGYFNILHPGHLRLLKFAADCADILIVGIFSDQDNTAIITEELRLKAVQSICYIDYALILP